MYSFLYRQQKDIKRYVEKKKKIKKYASWIPEAYVVIQHDGPGVLSQKRINCFLQQVGTL